MVDWPKPKIEDLPEATWERIEQRVMSQIAGDAVGPPIRHHGRRALWVGGLAAAAVAAIALIAVWPKTSSMLGPQHARVVTYDSPTDLSLARASVRVAPNSAVVTRADEHEALIVIEQGGVTCRVPRRADDERFLVRAGEAEIRVVGTEFSVFLSGGETRVQVEEGVVAVLYRGDETLLAAGESWATPVVAVAPAAPHPTSKDVDDEAEPRDAPEIRQAEPAARSSRKPDKRTGDRSEKQPATTDVEPTPSAKTPEPSPRDLYRQAAALEASDPAAAARLYQQVEDGSGPWAAMALFARGRLDIDRGRRDRGKALLRQYLSRFPDGANAADARALLDRD